MAIRALIPSKTQTKSLDVTPSLSLSLSCNAFSLSLSAAEYKKMTIRKTFPRPQKRVQIATAPHDYSKGIIQYPDLKAMKKGFRWLLWLEANLTVLLNNNGVSTLTYAPDVLIRLLSNITLTIPGVFSSQKSWSGVQWCRMHTLKGVLGTTRPNFAPRSEILQVTAFSPATVDVFLRIPIWVPDPFAAGFERCGLTVDHVQATQISISTGDGSNLPFFAFLPSDITGEWRLVAEGYTANKVIVPPYETWDYYTVTAGTDKNVYTKDAHLRLLAAYGTEGSDGSILQGDKDQLSVDGDLLFDSKDTNGMIVGQRFCYEQAGLHNRESEANQGGISNDLTDFPLFSGKAGAALSAMWYVDPMDDIGNQPSPSGSMSLTPESTREVFEIQYKYYTLAIREKHQQVFSQSKNYGQIISERCIGKQGEMEEWGPSMACPYPMELCF